MKTLLISMIFILFLSSSFFAQYSRGTVLEGKIIKSKILDKDVRYTIYLPFDYNTSERYYPVVYLLHGYTDNDMGWLQFGEINMLADKAIAENDIPPMIIVTPDAGVSWYINNYNGKVNYEDFFIKEFIPQIESQYRIRGEKRYRAVAGLSMGGYGALIYAFKYPEMFSACVPFSAAIYTIDDILEFSQDRWNAVESVVYGPDLKGESRITGHLKRNNVLEILKNISPEKIKTVRFYIDCGDDDHLLDANCDLHKMMEKKDIPHEFRVRDGGHQWSYWRSGIINALKFIGVSFHQN